MVVKSGIILSLLFVFNSFWYEPAKILDRENIVSFQVPEELKKIGEEEKKEIYGQSENLPFLMYTNSDRSVIIEAYAQSINLGEAQRKDFYLNSKQQLQSDSTITWLSDEVKAIDGHEFHVFRMILSHPERPVFMIYVSTIVQGELLMVNYICDVNLIEEWGYYFNKSIETIKILG